ncbi:MAG: bifunctional methylenetetrahydrofolate dehydrogenase/methenyltetrahydrofolate cyclohydrolase FolD [Candidatus Sericytochromatia bacterium]|nr:bifunctional methylenetetrahydrofolate dehydrogenase/methenyltetrahydrofolate cyclohydrolase FolD [Candidatus Sericytochromatia bacterium]
MTEIINGKEISKKILYEIKVEAEQLYEKYEFKAGLAVVLIGNDPASQIYVKNKRATCEKIGFYSEAYDLSEEVKENELIKLLDELNAEPSIHGILVQLPLPKHLDERKILEYINPQKDVDGFHPSTQAKLFLGTAKLEPCTPKGIIELLKRSNIQIEGKHCVILGRSNIVGKPLALMLLKENATVTICHSKTENIAEIARTADILISAIGKANFVTADMVKENAVVIDVGMNRSLDNKLVGDVDYQNVFPKVRAITPVPGGVGPMTIAMLMKNTLEAAKLIKKIKT